MKGSKNTIDKEEEIKELIKLNLKNKEISKKLQISESTIKRVKRKNNLQHFRIKSFENEIINYRKENPNINNAIIAKKFNCSTAFIKNIHKKFNLNNNWSAVKDYKLNLFQLSCLVGTIMGDANLRICSKSSGKGSFNHVESNKDYVLYKQNLLEPICLNKIIRIIPSTKNAKPQLNVKFKSCPLLKDIYRKIYVNKKRLTPFILKHFTDASLALYYMDDGYKKVSKNNYSYVITMYSFMNEEKLNLAKLLNDKWGIKATVTKTGIYIRAKSRQKFKYLIKPYIVPSMKYKL